MVYLPVLIVLLYSGLSLFSIVASLTFQTYRPLAVVANFNGLSVKHHRRNFGSNHRVATLSESRAGSEMDNMNGERVERGPIAPSRNDVCETFISGYIGTEPKEIYLANGHYLLTFSLAVVGHYEAVHDWEINKPAETMWMNIEMWDNVAKSNMEYLRKGSPIAGRGVLILNKWVDKKSGEDRKAFKLRLTTLASQQELIDFLCKSDPLIQHPPLPISEYGMPPTPASYGGRDAGDNYGRADVFRGGNQGGGYSSATGTGTSANQANSAPSRFNNAQQYQSQSQSQNQAPIPSSSGRAASNFQSRPAPRSEPVQRNYDNNYNNNSGRNMNMDDIPF